MRVYPFSDDQPDDTAAAALSRLVAGQISSHDLRAGTAIVVVEGHLQLGFRDHSLAWLGNTVPLASITLHEGERFVTPQSGIVSVSVTRSASAAFLLQTASAASIARRVVDQAIRHLPALARGRLRRTT